MDPQPVTIDDYREALRRLLIGWKTHTRDGIEIPTSRELVIRLVYPWVAQVHRFGEAFLQLEKRGYAHEGMPWSGLRWSMH